MDANGWAWDEESQRWTAQRGIYKITAEFPQDSPPPVAAHAFGVLLPRAAEARKFRYEADFGLRPQRGAAGVRGIAWEYSPSGSRVIWYCEDDHAPGVDDCRKVTDAQREAAQACAEQWLHERIRESDLVAWPIVRAAV